jgi:tight adherence protein B
MVLIVTIVIAVVLLIIGVIISTREERKLVDDRISRYMQTTGGTTVAGEYPKEKGESPLTAFLNERMSQLSWGQKIAKDLARADIKMKPGEYLALLAISIVGVGGAAWWLGGHDKWPFFAVGGLIGYFLPGIYVSRQQKVRLRKFDEQLGDMLNLMVNGLRAGYSTMQALEAVSRELPPPISDEFRRVVQEMQLGVSMEKALENLVRRIPSPDLDLVITAMNVQREVGGNLSEILETISHTIRERVRIKGEIRVLTSQVRSSGTLLSFMPIALGVFLFFVRNEYISKFWDPELNREFFFIGFVLLGVAGILIVIGNMAINKIADIEV